MATICSDLKRTACGKSRLPRISGSTIDFVPEHKFVIIVLANRNGETLPKTRRKAMEMLLPLKPFAREQAKPVAMAAEELKR